MTHHIVHAMAVITLTACLVTIGIAGAEERSPQGWLELFAREWDEQQWQVRSSAFPDGYLRPLDDTGWKARMRAMQGLVAHGKEAIPVLLDALQDDRVPKRILAAQTLGYLAPDVPHEPLLHAAQKDSHPAVRLYAVDALGMQGANDVDWDALRKAETNPDVRKHIGYAAERVGKPLAKGIVQRLKGWDPRTMDSAVVGKPAPDFELESATGETVRLSDFRGKKPVVLVFVYGDT